MILCLGGVTTDRICFVDEIPAWDEVGYIKDFSFQQGGMAATAAVAASILGKDAEFIGAIGNDEGAKFILNSFAAKNVETSRVKIFEDETTSFSIVLVNAKGAERTILQYKGVQQKSSLEIEIDLAGIDLVHIDGYFFDTALELVKTAKDKNIPVVIDPSSKIYRNKNEQELLKYCSYIIPGFNLAKKLSGKTEPESICRSLFHNDCKAVVVTKGEEGCYYFDGGEFKHVPAFKVNVVDTTGAGDVFHGAFLVALQKKYNIEKTCRFANAVAALKCEKPGGQSGIPTFKEVQGFLDGFL